MRVCGPVRKTELLLGSMRKSGRAKRDIEKSILKLFEVTAFTLLVQLLSLVLPLTATAKTFELPGQLGVDQVGDATYSIPIDIPPGAAGMVPKITLNYGSRSGDGPLGEGWSIGGISKITRCPQTYAQDNSASNPVIGVGVVNNNNTDRLCLDGHRLMVVSGTYGAPAAVYRKELDDFTQVVEHGSINAAGSYFTVSSKDGTVYEYGNNSVNDGGTPVTTNARVVLSAGPIMEWELDRAADASGNFWYVTYTAQNSANVVLPSTINYTGNTPVGGGTPTATYNSITFGYTGVTAGNAWSYHQGGVRVASATVLTSIYADAGASKVSHYVLGYQQSPVTSREELTSVQKCDNGTPNVCLAATTFTWPGASGAGTFAVTAGVQTGWCPIANISTGDFDGDGKTDLICLGGGGPNQILVALSNGTGTFTSKGWKTVCSTGGVPLLGDFDGDGKTDLVCLNADNTQQVLISNGNGTFAAKTATAGAWCDSPADISAGDFDGDGRTDLICNYANGSHAVAFSSGDGTFATPAQWPSSSTPWCSPANLQMGDFNGDGKQDLMCMGTGANANQQIVAFSNGDGTFAQPSGWQPPFCASPGNIQFGDLDGDGKTDMVCNRSNGSSQVAFSFGDGTFDVSANWTNSGAYWCASGSVKIGDFNGDGRDDLACEDSSNYIEVAFSDGNGNFIPQSGSSPCIGYPQFGDFTGYGRQDLSCIAPANYEVRAAGGAPDMLTSVTSGLGAIDSVGYTAVSFRGSTPRARRQGLVGPLNVVGDTTRDNGIGGVYVQTYTYGLGQVDFTGRGFQGFASVAANDFCFNAVSASTNIQTTVNYNQTWPLTGTVQSQTVQHYTQSGTSGYCINETSPVTIGQVSNGYVVANPSSATDFVTLHSSVQTTKELDGTLLSTLTTSWFYDTNGNLYVQGKNSSENWVSKTCYTYKTYPNNWMSSLGLLTKTLDSGVVPGTTPDCTVASTRTNSYTPNPDTGLVMEQVIEPTIPANRVTSDYTRDAFGNVLTAVVTGNFATRTTTMHYETYGRFTNWIKNTLNQVTFTNYNPRFGALNNTTDPNGVVTAWTYDTFGRKLTQTVTDSTGANTLPTTTWTYNSGTGCVAGSFPLCSVQTSTPGQPTVSTYYDIVERAEFSTAPTFDGSATIINSLTAYNALGWVASVTHPYSSGTTHPAVAYSYDDVGRLLTKNNPDGGKVAHTYGTAAVPAPGTGNFSTDAATGSDTNSPASITARTTTTTTNSLGQVVSVLTPLTLGNPTTYAYEPFGNVASATDPQGNVVSITYDVRGHKTAQNDPDKGNWTFVTDALGELTSRTDATPATVSFAYDALGRPTSETGAVNPTSSWTYDNATCNGIGKLDTSSTGSGAGMTNRKECYDTFGRPNETDTTVDTAPPYTTLTAYDASGRLYTNTYPSGIVVGHQYNALGYLRSVNSGGVALWVPNTENDALQVTQATYGNGVYTTASYDPESGRVTNIQPMTAAGVRFRQFNYTWDVAGNLTTRADLTHAEENFTYDTLNRLTGDSQVSGGAGNVPTKTFTYTVTGNIANKSDVGTYQYGAGGAGPHAVTKITGTTNDGRGGSHGLVTDPTYIYDADGRLTGGTNGRSYTYNGFEAPATITNAGGTVTFTFDAEHNRVKQATPSGTTVYVAGQGVRTEIFMPPACSPTPCNNPPPTYNSYVMAGGQIVDMVQNNGPATTVTNTYFHTDHLGSTILVTGDSGAAVKQMSYDPWGKRRNLDGSDDPYDTLTSPVNRGFTGQEELADSYLIDMNARVYDPQIGKFGSADPADGGPVGAGDWNRYAYVKNNPLNLTDPSGESGGGFSFSGSYTFFGDSVSISVGGGVRFRRLFRPLLQRRGGKFHFKHHRSIDRCYCRGLLQSKYGNSI